MQTRGNALRWGGGGQWSWAPSVNVRSLQHVALRVFNTDDDGPWHQKNNQLQHGIRGMLLNVQATTKIFWQKDRRCNAETLLAAMSAHLFQIKGFSIVSQPMTNVQSTDRVCLRLEPYTFITAPYNVLPQVGFDVTTFCSLRCAISPFAERSRRCAHSGLTTPPRP